MAVRADVIEAVVVHANVRDVRRHEVDGIAPTDVEKRLVIRDLELINRRAELKALRPLGPAARGILALEEREVSLRYFNLSRLLPANRGNVGIQFFFGYRFELGAEAFPHIFLLPRDILA